eukprot:s33_g12.t1
MQSSHDMRNVAGYAGELLDRQHHALLRTELRPCHRQTAAVALLGRRRQPWHTAARRSSAEVLRHFEVPYVPTSWKLVIRSFRLLQKRTLAEDGGEILSVRMSPTDLLSVSLRVECIHLIQASPRPCAHSSTAPPHLAAASTERLEGSCAECKDERSYFADSECMLVPARMDYGP